MIRYRRTSALPLQSTGSARCLSTTTTSRSKTKKNKLCSHTTDIVYYVEALTRRKSKSTGKRSIAVSNYSLTATGTHVPYGITQCYLPPGRDDIPALTPAEAGTRFCDPGRMQGWVDLAGWSHTETHPSTNRARRGLISFMQRTPLTTTLRDHYAWPIHGVTMT